MPYTMFQIAEGDTSKALEQDLLRTHSGVSYPENPGEVAVRVPSCEGDWSGRDGRSVGGSDGCRHNCLVLRRGGLGNLIPAPL